MNVSLADLLPLSLDLALLAGILLFFLASRLLDRQAAWITLHWIMRFCWMNSAG